MSAVAHVVDADVDTEVLSMPEGKTCPACDAPIPDGIDICPPCLDEMRKKDGPY